MYRFKNPRNANNIFQLFPPLVSFFDLRRKKPKTQINTTYNKKISCVDSKGRYNTPSLMFLGL